MTPRERQLACIRRQPADRVSTDVMTIENQDAVAAFLGIDKQNLYEALGIDGRIVSASYAGELQSPAQGVAFTEWGTPKTGDYGTGRAYPLARATSVRTIEEYRWPDPARYDYAAAAQRASQLRAQYALRGPSWHPLFCRVCDLLGMENAMIKMAAEPLLFEAVLERVFVHTVEYCRRLLDACGEALPIFYLGDDFATQRGMMISPELWRRFLKPRYARLFGLAKQRDKLVWFHSCGD
ncbi:MAG: hypothetical protein FJ278_07955, partial [Planctomycetes bacterium]|nr:hypothetical protein [Planctomycetota bacterium]